MMANRLIASLATGTLLMLVIMASAPTSTGAFHLSHISKEELVQKLADNSLEPDQVFKLLDKTASKDDVKVNGVTVPKYLGLNSIKLNDCDDSETLARLTLCKAAKINEAPESLLRYCNDRLGKLMALCAKNIDGLADQLLFDVQPHDLDVLRLVMKKHWDDEVSEDVFKQIINEYMEDHQYDKSKEKKHEDLDRSCGNLVRELKPVQVIEDNAGQFGVQTPMKPTIEKWMKAFRMCEFYLANN